MVWVIIQVAKELTVCLLPIGKFCGHSVKLPDYLRVVCFFSTVLGEVSTLRLPAKQLRHLGLFILDLHLDNRLITKTTTVWKMLGVLLKVPENYWGKQTILPP